MANTAETPAEFTQLHPLSAEAVAKNLLQKFANRKHPAACELQWLVSFQDAPQTLLPLPQTVAVAPDDAVEDEGMKHKPASRQNSLPVSINFKMSTSKCSDFAMALVIRVFCLYFVSSAVCGGIWSGLLLGLRLSSMLTTLQGV